MFDLSELIGATLLLRFLLSEENYAYYQDFDKMRCIQFENVGAAVAQHLKAATTHCMT
jgi:hypothetical protein